MKFHFDIEVDVDEELGFYRFSLEIPEIREVIEESKIHPSIQIQDSFLQEDQQISVNCYGE